MSSAEPRYLGMDEKLRVLRQVAERYPRRIMIETGLFNGRGSGMNLLDLFGEYHAIDTQASNITRAAENEPRGWYHYGDSGMILPVLLTEIHEPVFFWLDAHYWESDLDWPDGQEGCALLREIQAIRAWPYASASVLLIDDVRQLAGGPEAQPGWPSLQDVYDALGTGIPRTWSIEVDDDILRCLPW